MPAIGVARRERVESDAHHLDAAIAHVDERLDHVLLRLQVARSFVSFAIVTHWSPIRSM